MAGIIQDKVAEALRQPGSSELLDEEEVLSTLFTFLAARGASPEEWAEQQQLLRGLRYRTAWRRKRQKTRP